MKARICDICGHPFSKDERRWQVKTRQFMKLPTGETESKRLDICIECQYKIIYYCKKHRGDSDVE